MVRHPFRKRTRPSGPGGSNPSPSLKNADVGGARRVGRAVECAALLTRMAPEMGHGGSNPPPSASVLDSSLTSECAMLSP